jgi:electron transport complex protein RnfA
MDFLVQILILSFSAAIINNYTLVWFVGSCSFLGCTSRLDTATGMGLAVTFVMSVSGIFSWVMMEYVLRPHALDWIHPGIDLHVLNVLVYMIIIAAAVQVVEMYLRKFFPPLYRAFGIYLPLIVTNCAVLLACLQIEPHVYRRSEYWGIVEGTTYITMAGLGYTLALVIMAGIREEMQLSNTPKPFRGPGIALIIAGVLAMAFMGFSGVDKSLETIFHSTKTVAAEPVTDNAATPKPH